jgi:phosphatidylserine/phosphatidylglycerophosphate/cardiolipin synthase-like enzyme
MDEILAHLRQSIEDEVFSKTEKRTLKGLLGGRPLDQNQLNLLRSKVYELANERARQDNYKFILEWVRNVNSALSSPTTESSDAFFSPGDACRNVIINQISQATTRLQICVFTISDDSITDAILTSHKRGLDIKIITDNDKSFDEGSDIEQLARSGISVKMDVTPNHMHHKFMVVDQKALITGSYNWTRSAARYNHENILLTREGGVVKSFLKEFDQLWKEMKGFS